MTLVFCNTSFEGVHCYPEAPEEVSYIRVPHRHIFNVRVDMEVFHDDREIEFIMLKHRVNSFISRFANPIWNMGHMSCEQVANMVIEFLKAKYRKRFIAVTVDEDGENGACVIDADGKINFEDYQTKSYRAIQHHIDNKEEVMHWAIGLGEESGEVLSVIKHKYYTGNYDVEELVGELGDALWHIAALCTANGFSMQDVAEYNISKLIHRYPTDKFDKDRSFKRHELEKEFSQTQKAKEIMERIRGERK